jgi:sarcosine oxidase, subunit gamma
VAEAKRQQPGRPERSEGVALGERTGLEMVEVSAWRGTSRKVCRVITEVLGVPPPEQPNTVSTREATRIIWLGPDRWLILRPVGGGLASELIARLPRDAAAVVEAGAGRRIFTISGSRSRDVLAKHLSLDLSGMKFPAGRCAQSAMAHMGVLVHAESEGTFAVLVHRSFARDLWEVLIDAGLEFGIEARPPDCKSQ